MNQAKSVAVLVLLAVTSLSFADGSAAKSSSQIEQEIWARESAYLNHLIAGQLDEVQKFWHEKFIGWPSHAAVPVNRDTGRESLEALLAGIALISVEIRPQAMTIVDDLAVAHYFAVVEQKKDDEEPSRSEFRITHIWLNTLEGWKIVGGMSSN
ncbi:MAG: YybH family protein [Planctomycetota bacterium]